MTTSTRRSAWFCVLHTLYVAFFLKLATSFPVDSHDDAPSNDASVPPTVHLGYAKYRGTALSGGVNQFLGMRYAAPPLGNLRWRAPQDPVHESGTQNATEFGAICIGVGNTLSNSTNEDCLFLDVFAPRGATTDSKLPVWFFIQGGGYAVDGQANFNGSEVVMNSKLGLVFVELNWRVGSFGFLASKDVQEEGDLNVGLLDQRKALQWVQKYIHLFGGDPEHVVIHGASAGAGSIAHQLAAYGGRNDGLFAGAIAESPFWPTHRTVAESEFQFKNYVDAVKCNGQSDVMACLRSKDTATLQAADVDMPFPGSTTVPLWSFLPVIDGTFSQDLLYNQFEQGKIVKVPLMVGDDTNEGTDFAPNATSSEEFLNFIQANYPLLSNEQLEEINKTYPLGTPFPEHLPWYTPSVGAYGESTLTCPGLEMTRSLAKYFSPQKSWNYRYNVIDYQDESEGLGVPHVAETPAVFGPGNTGTFVENSYETYNAPAVPLVMDYWISFILSLNPNTHREVSSPVWQPWGTSGNQRLKFQLPANSTGTEMEQVPMDQLQRCALWKSLATTMQQ